MIHKRQGNIFNRVSQVTKTCDVYEDLGSLTSFEMCDCGPVIAGGSMDQQDGFYSNEMDIASANNENLMNLPMTVDDDLNHSCPSTPIVSPSPTPSSTPMNSPRNHTSETTTDFYSTSS